jgi:nicotinamide mononucleotide transporter
MTGIYAWIFFEVRLYSDFGLQLIYVGLQVYGWWFWVARKDSAQARELAPIEKLSPVARLGWGVAGLIFAGILGFAMHRLTDASLPYWDAATTAFSLVAQSLLARKYLENWLVWIGVDVMSVGIYAVKGLHVTALLYAVFLCLAVWGLVEWTRSYQQSRQAAAP